MIKKEAYCTKHFFLFIKITFKNRKMLENEEVPKKIEDCVYI